MYPRSQQTISRAVDFHGIGFLTGADIRVRFLPADTNHGIAFQRTDLSDKPIIPATIDHVESCSRRTVITKNGVSVSLIEHVMAALAGLRVDNCLVQLNGPEPPGSDGSALEFANALGIAGITTQDETRSVFRVETTTHITDDQRQASIIAAPNEDDVYGIEYRLDYGADSPIPQQTAQYTITPVSFLQEIAASRTFILETEIEALRAQGFGERTTVEDLLVFGQDGVIGNRMRSRNECARHKLLDCIGDFALMGCDFEGTFIAIRSGHAMNHDLIRKLVSIRDQQNEIAA